MSQAVQELSHSTYHMYSIVVHTERDLHDMQVLEALAAHAACAADTARNALTTHGSCASRSTDKECSGAAAEAEAALLDALTLLLRALDPEGFNPEGADGGAGARPAGLGPGAAAAAAAGALPALARWAQARMRPGGHVERRAVLDFRRARMPAAPLHPVYGFWLFRSGREMMGSMHVNGQCCEEMC